MESCSLNTGSKRTKEVKQKVVHYTRTLLTLYYLVLWEGEPVLGSHMVQDGFVDEQEVSTADLTPVTSAVKQSVSHRPTYYRRSVLQILHL